MLVAFLSSSSLQTMALAQVACVILSFLFLLVNFVDVSTGADSTGAVDFRLPQTFTPVHYDLSIITDVKEPDFKFNGKVIIKVTCNKDTPDLVLHMKQLTIHNDNVTCTSAPAGNITKVKSHKYDEKLEMVTFTFDQSFVAKQEYTVEIPFDGVISADLEGFYRSSYIIEKTNTTKWLATTQFEPIYARRAFPCFDEPAMKATFTISVGHPKDLIAISNMPVNRSEPMPEKPDWTLDIFQQSVKMSTYLVSFIISDFSFKESKGSVPFRVFTHKDKLPEIELAAEVGPKFVSFFEEYFAIKYSLPKIDLIAIPDFDEAAMENYGLITFREAALFVDKVRTPTDYEYNAVTYIAHEISHQWFGNLVTMKWWNDMWLNEGFATYMESLAADSYVKAKDEWTVLREDLITSARALYPEDALSTSHPIQVTINDPTEIDDLFDYITYKKGSYLIHMVTMFLTKEVFQKGLTAYLTKFSYSNAESKDLWDALTEAGHQAKILPDGLTVNTIMDSWTTKAGFPILEVKREGSTLHFTQKRFLTDTPVSNGSDAWWLPLMFVGSTTAEIFNSTKPVWLPGDSKGSGHDGKEIIASGQYELTGVKDTDWFLVGKEMSVLMRVNYDEKNWNLIIAQLKTDHTKIPVMNRVQLIMDVDEFAKYNIMTYDRAFQLISYIAKEEEILPWRVTLYFLYTLMIKLERTKAIEDFNAFARKLTGERYKKVAATKPSPEHYGQRYQAFRFIQAGYNFKIPELEEKARAEFAAWKKSPDTYVINPDMEEIAFMLGVQYGTKEDFDFVYERYEKTESISEKESLLGGLADTKDMGLLKQYMEDVYSNHSKIRMQDMTSAFAWIVENADAFQTAKDFLLNNADKIYTLFGPDNSYFAEMLNYLCLKVNSETEMKEITEFIAKNDKYVKSSKIVIQKCESVMKVNVQWHKDNYQEIVDFLAKNK
uniref:Aminopeptidase n=1 Tax=Cacopsylla melanoneura TaxID=428564 RepID=A0A8D9EPL0_9HEMI